MNIMNKILSFVILVAFVAVSSSWQSVEARVRLSTSPNSNSSTSTGKVLKREIPGSTTSDEHVYIYGCDWDGAYYKPMPFSISADKQVFFTAGNVIHETEQKFEYLKLPGQDKPSSCLARNSQWFIGEHQWESIYNLTDIYYLQEDEQSCITVGTRGVFNAPVTLSMPTYLKYDDQFKNTDSDFQFEDEDDWGAKITPKNDRRRYFLLQDVEWNYLLNKRKDASSLRGVGKMKCVVEDSKLYSEAGLFIYPDGYTGSKVGTAAVDSVTWFAMEREGVVFFPTTNKANGVEYGLYWVTSLSGNTHVLYFDTTGKIEIRKATSDDQACARLAYYYKQGLGTEENPFKIATGADLAAFRDEVNSGRTDMCGELVSHISLSEYDDWEPIGQTLTLNDIRSYCGKFVGNGYKITGMKQKSLYGDGSLVVYTGLFGYVGDGADISDFELSGDIEITEAKSVLVYGASPAIGIISMITDLGVTHKGVSISDILCTCKYSIDVDALGVYAGGIVGAVIGDSNNKELLQISRCWNITGSVEVASKTLKQIYMGGIVGYGPTEGSISITDCGYYSSLDYNGNRTGCGILGYLDCKNSELTASISNCFVYYGGEYAIANLGNTEKGGATVTLSNNYYRIANYDDDKVVKGLTTTSDAVLGQVDADIRSGKTTYLLNRKVSGGEPWHQTIGVFPVLQKSGKLVYATDDPNVFSNTDPSALTTRIAQPCMRTGEVEYYDLSGRRIGTKSGMKGISIVVEKLSDGTVRRSKIVKK